MGYTHYWTIFSTAAWQETWPQLVTDTNLIIAAAGVQLTKNEGDPEEPPEVSTDGICLNGYDEPHEPFTIGPYATDFDYCKTARKEYDVVVTAVLLRAWMLAGRAISVQSDGSWDEGDWDAASDLVGKLWPGEEITCPWGEREEDVSDE